MKQKLSVFLLALFFLFANYSFKVSASEVLLPAVIETMNGQKWGYIDQTGGFAIQPGYNFAREFNDRGIAIVANGSNEFDICKVYFINKSGKIVSGPFSSFLPDFENSIAVLNTMDTGSTVVDSSGKVLFTSKYKIYDYKDGLLSFSDANMKYGFMDLTGKVIIPAKFLNADDFNDGRAVVKTGEDKFSVIDKSGRALEVLKSYNEYESSEGFTPFYDEKSKLYGYKNYSGDVVIEPAFYSAGRFSRGYAVVSVESREICDTYGLIDTNGKYILKPEYSGITYLGSDMFAASRNLSAPYSDYYFPKALFNSKGEQLSDFKFYRINQFEGDHAVACDNTSTFFIDKKGNMVDTLPNLPGIGDIKYIGSVLQAKLDGGLTYLKENGAVLWRKDRIIPLNNRIKANKVSFRRDYLTYIEYPEITGLEDSAVQESINKRLKSEFIGEFENTAASNSEDPEDISYDFSVSLNKNLLIIEKNGYWYPIGAAHGLPSVEYFHIDIKTGTFYQLKDLFKAGSKYADELTSLVDNQIALNTKISLTFPDSGMTYFEEKPEVTENHYFVLGSDSLKIYYYPYAIAPYAAGFPQFEIPYGKISSIIDTNGAFWNSFDKTIIDNKPRLFRDMDISTVSQIESLMSSYEQNMISSINNNTFSTVEPYLLKGSNLYSSQKKLVSDLFSKNTEEKLNKYEIYAIEKVDDSNTYRVYVIEEVAVKYSGGDFVNTTYNWCYTVRPDEDLKYKLSDIVKW